MTMRTEPLRVALAQLNTTVGDIDGNAAKVAGAIDDARSGGAQLVVVPELAITGYPPEDLLLKTHFLDAAGAAVRDLAKATEGIVALVGFPEGADDVYNAAAVLADGELVAVYRKMFLPNYGVFDEHRYFQSGTAAVLIGVGDAVVGITICEDIWEPGPPASSEALAGAQVIVNLSASPYHAGKPAEREQMLIQRARDNVAAVVFCNLVGGQDELVFDGRSVAIDQDGAILARAPQFEEATVICEIDPGAVAAARLRDTRHRAAVGRGRDGHDAPVHTLARLRVEPAAATGSDVGGPIAEPLGPEAEVYAALITGLRDYVDKNGFERVVIALSGGIDSALVALLAVDALGADRVVCVTMPSPYSSEGTRSDARAIAANLGTELLELPIEPLMGAYDEALAEPFAGRERDLTEENLQARSRGNLVMALSNKFGWLVLTTGNKSELSVGYATLYGDMAGGFAVLRDVYKGWVYRLVRWRNRGAREELVPASVLERPPSAELRHEQLDEESLPPYDVLDAILEGYVEGDLDAEQLAPPGIKISTRAFGRDRRLPITNRFGR
jgi:NAD+ synthase (glutamine-hydrolysing)